RPRRGRRHRLPTQMDQDRGEGAGGCRRQRDRPDGRRSRPAPVHARVRHRHRPRRLGGRAGELVHRAGGGQRIPDTALVDRRRGRRRPGIGQRGFHRRVAGRLRRPVRQALVPRARPLHPLRPGGAVPVVPSPQPVRDRGMSERDSGMTTARRRTWVRLAVAVLLVAVLALLPWIGSSFTVFVATRILILGIFAMAFDLVFGFGGMPSLGHAAFYGLGAYVVGLGITRWGWGAGTVLVVAILGAAVLGLVTGMLTLRTRGIYLLLLTLAIGEAVWAVAFQQVSLTRGDNGIANIGRDTLPEVVRSTNGFYLLALSVFVVVYLVLRWYTRSSFGRVLVGARESESRMAAFGYRVGAYRVAAFTVSAALASIAGVLSAYLIEFVNPDVLDWPVSAEILLVTILGGAGTIVGPAVGAGFLITFETLVSQYSERWMLALGVVYIVVILFLPEGLASLGRRVRRR